MSSKRPFPSPSPSLSPSPAPSPSSPSHSVKRQCTPTNKIIVINGDIAENIITNYIQLWKIIIDLYFKIRILQYPLKIFRDNNIYIYLPKSYYICYYENVIKYVPEIIKPYIKINYEHLPNNLLFNISIGFFKNYERSNIIKYLLQFYSTLSDQYIKTHIREPFCQNPDMHYKNMYEKFLRYFLTYVWK